jgi:tetratricopeptide (TPR) repeat protein
LTKKLPLFFLCFATLLFSCASTATTAEEYYSLGMAYYDMGKYEEAERWFNKAKVTKNTMTASEYQLGRIAFETGKYEEAAEYFEKILRNDSNNVMALKSASYARIKTGELEKAEELYSRVRALVPDDADDGYNHALVLFALERYEDCENILRQFEQNIANNKDTLLLLARVQRAQDKPEAIDNYDLYLSKNSDPVARSEYAGCLEKQEYYARAIDEYKKIVDDKTEVPGLKKSDVRFNMARLMLIADPENENGMTELNSAVTEGYADIDEIKKLLDESAISESRKEEISGIVSGLLTKQEAAEAAEANAATQ